MRFYSRRLLSAALCVGVSIRVAGGQTPAPRPPARSATARNAGGRPVHNEAERAAAWKVIDVPFNRAGLSQREQAMVARLADACRQIDQIYLRQMDLGGYAMFHTTQNPAMLRLFRINGSRWDLIHDNEPFSGEQPLAPGHELYPYGLTRAEIEQYVAAHPEQKQAIFNPWTVVRTAPLDLDPRLSQPVVYKVPERLFTYPYHEAYARWLRAAADDLRAAAKLSPDPAFAHYLDLRAEALLSDDYYPSDLAWLALKNPKIDLIFAPDETHADGVLGVKTVYGAAILIRNEAESQKLALFQQYEAAMQQALPIPSADKPGKEGQPTPMEVADAPLRAGDLRFGYQAVADNLPNDPRVHLEKGSKKIFFKNFMDARVREVILPIAARTMTQASDVTANGYLTWTVLHELSHGLGPAFAHRDGQQVPINEVPINEVPINEVPINEVPINEAIGPLFSALEESKADITGLFLAKWLVEQEVLPAAELNTIYASFVAGQLRTLRFGTGEAHGRGAIMEFNFLAEQHAITQDPQGRFLVDDAVLPGAIAKLTTQLLTFEAQGDRAGAEAWFARYGTAPDTLTQALDRTTDIPVDVTPDFELTRGERP